MPPDGAHALPRLCAQHRPRLPDRRRPHRPQRRRSGGRQADRQGRRCRQGDLRLAARRGARARSRPASSSTRRSSICAATAARPTCCAPSPASRWKEIIDEEWQSIRGRSIPITLGHLDIIRRGAHLVDKLVIGVTTNPSKEPMFTVDERLAMVRREVAEISGNIEVVEFNSLLMDFAERAGRDRRSCAACARSPTSNMSSRWRG